LRQAWDNPVALREWRALRQTCADWRLWLGLRLPRHASAWGLPAIAWFAFLPYLLWVLMAGVRRFSGQDFFFPDEMPFDAMLLGLVLCGGYAALTSGLLMATTIAGERGKGTLDSLRCSLGPNDILIGFLLGRQAPVLVAWLAVGLAWALLQPQYTPLLEPYSPFSMGPPELALHVWVLGAVCLAWGCLGLACSVRARTGWAAIAGIAVAMTVHLVLLVPAALLVPERFAPLALLGTCVVTAALAYRAAARGLGAPGRGRDRHRRDAEGAASCSPGL
jgi:hypothetical protein